MDLYNNEIMSYSVSLHPDLAQIREMLDELSKKLPKGATPILHSDPRLAIPTCRIPKIFKGTQHNTEYVTQGQLHG